MFDPAHMLDAALNAERVKLYPIYLAPHFPYHTDSIKKLRKLSGI